MALLAEIATFLRCVLPGEGLYCAVVFDTPHPKAGHAPRQIICDTIDQLAQTIAYYDDLGKTVYHACATYRERQGVWNERRQKWEFRTQANAFKARSLWLEVDAGTDKPYADDIAAAEAVHRFCVDCAIPLPVFVGSGYGVHCYWPLAADIEASSWQDYAVGLKSLCAEKGLKADPTRTADVASILRPVGSTNRKHGSERRVRSDERTYRQYDLTLFRSLLAARPQEPRIHDRHDGSLLARIGGSSNYTAAYADRIADRCAQLHRFRISGNLPEPAWYAALGVLSRCEDGFEKAHRWSANDYPGYDERATTIKFERAKQLTGATLCSHFNNITTGVCTSCPLWGKINSPITLGAQEVPQIARTPIDHQPSQATKQPPEGLDINELPPAPQPFRWSSAGQLCIASEDDKGEQELLLVSEYPVYLDSVQVAELSNDSFSYQFRRFLPKHGWSMIGIDAQTLHGAAGIATMFGKGQVIHDPRLFLQYARAAVDEYNLNEELATRFDQFGWKNDNSSFLYGKMLYTAAGPVEAIGAKEVAARSQYLGPKKNANLIAWTEAADSLFATGMEASSVALLASLAAPLMRFQSADEGGGILHLFSPASGHGKTTTLCGAWSIWGDKQGLNLTNEDTRVAKPITLGTLANLPVIYDELRDKDPEVIRRFVVTFTEGRDRMRGTVDGTLRHVKSQWQTILLSAANQSLVEQLEHDGVDAPAFRVLELTITLPEQEDKTKGTRLTKVLTDNAGAAGDAYLRYLLHPPVMAWAKAALAQWTDEIWKVSGASNAHRFRVRMVGAIAVAAAMANKIEVLHFDTHRIMNYLMDQITSHKGTVTSQRSMMEQAVSALGQFINEHYGQMLVVADKFKPKGPRLIPIVKPHGQLCMRYEIATQRLFIAEGAFKEWCLAKHMSTRVVVEQLREGQVLVEGARHITLSAGTDIPGAQVKVLELNSQHPIMSGVVQALTSLRQEQSA